MKTLYLDIFSGISGDMLLGSMIDLGVAASSIEQELQKLHLKGYHLHVSRKARSAIQGVKFDVHPEHGHEKAHEPAPPHWIHHSHAHHAGHHHHHQEEHKHGAGHEHEHGSRDFSEIRRLIERSELSDRVKEKSIAIFRRIGEAEGKIHGEALEAVHFHEVGAVDSIVDIVGGMVAMERLGWPRVLSGPVVEGSGWVQCAHGRFPLPTMATQEILAARGISITQVDEPHEMVTPTGAAILAELAESFGPMRALQAERVGYGLGSREHLTRPNVLRAILGSATEPATAAGPASEYDWERDTVTLLETNLDDVTAEVLGYVSERAISVGALDVFQSPIQMKKGRAGTMLSVLCRQEDADRLTAMLLQETTAFGVRRSTMERCKLQRERVLVSTSYGELEVKLGRLNGVCAQVAPEYESCRAAAERTGAPLRAVIDAAIKAWHREA